MINYRHLGTARVCSRWLGLLPTLLVPNKLGRDELAIALTMRRGKQPGIVRHPRQHPAGVCLTFAKLRSASTSSRR
jgi:hypothetical protein